MWEISEVLSSHISLVSLWVHPMNSCDLPATRKTSQPNQPTFVSAPEQSLENILFPNKPLWYATLKSAFALPSACESLQFHFVYCCLVCSAICDSATQEVLGSSALCDQFCRSAMGEGGEGFVSSSFILLWFLGHKDVVSSLFCHLPSSLYEKGQILLDLSSHTTWCKDCSICMGRAMGGAGVRYQSDGSNFMLSQKENKWQV